MKRLQATWINWLTEPVHKTSNNNWFIFRARSLAARKQRHNRQQKRWGRDSEAASHVIGCWHGDGDLDEGFNGGENFTTLLWCIHNSRPCCDGGIKVGWQSVAPSRVSSKFHLHSATWDSQTQLFQSLSSNDARGSSGLRRRVFFLSAQHHIKRGGSDQHWLM